VFREKVETNKNQHTEMYFRIPNFSNYSIYYKIVTVKIEQKQKYKPCLCSEWAGEAISSKEDITIYGYLSSPKVESP